MTQPLAPALTRLDGSAPGDLDLLETAGRRLDAAVIRFELAGAFATLSPAGFAGAEEEFFAAQDGYRETLRDITGADPDGILRRLAR
jgi:hypothetical protein